MNSNKYEFILKECIMTQTHTIHPSVLSGEVEIPSSKSVLHRAVFCGLLANGNTKITNVSYNEDINATLCCAESLGAKVIKVKEENTISITSSLFNNNCLLDCNQSGTTLRFIIPITAALGGNFTFIGNGRLPLRPLKELTEVLCSHGITCKQLENDFLPLEISGHLNAGEYFLPGNVSSQYLSGLLFALPLLKDNSVITLTTELESAAYVAMTIDMQSRFNVKIEEKSVEYNDGSIKNQYIIKGNQKYIPCQTQAEGDWSQAAFFLVAGAIGNKILCKNINEKTAQGDYTVLEILKKMGAKIQKSESGISVFANELHGADIDMAQIPDLLPPLAVAAALAKGHTRFTGCGRLRLKESDRLLAISEELRNIGAKTFVEGDNLIIEGSKTLKGGNTSCRGDHRIAMALSIAASRCEYPVTIEGTEAINKSYPAFFKDYINLGGVIS